MNWKRGIDRILWVLLIISSIAVAIFFTVIMRDEITVGIDIYSSNNNSNPPMYKINYEDYEYYNQLGERWAESSDTEIFHRSLLVGIGVSLAYFVVASIIYLIVRAIFLWIIKGFK